MISQFIHVIYIGHKNRWHQEPNGNAKLEENMWQNDIVNDWPDSQYSMHFTQDFNKSSIKVKYLGLGLGESKLQDNYVSVVSNHSE